jgi:hypothetical protein
MKVETITEGMTPYFVNILPYENAHTIVSGKWLYSLDMEPDKRLKPPIVENILRLRLRRKDHDLHIAVMNEEIQ